MGLNVGNLPVKQVYVGAAPVREVWVGGKKIWPTVEVHNVTLTDVGGGGVSHPLISVTVPDGQSWRVRIQGKVTTNAPRERYWPIFQIGSSQSSGYSGGSAVDFSGVVTRESSTIAMVTKVKAVKASFTGTVTIEK